MPLTRRNPPLLDHLRFGSWAKHPTSGAGTGCRHAGMAGLHKKP